MAPPLTQDGPLRPPAGRALVFVGFMGAGKSTAARRLARTLGLQVVDADATIAEHSACRSTAASPSRARRRSARRGASSCSSCSSAPTAASSRSAAARCTPSASAPRSPPHHRAARRRRERAWERAAGRGRPLARDRAGVRAAVPARAGRSTMAAADASCRPTGATASRALPSILALARPGAATGTRLLWATSASGDYPVFVGRGLLGARALAGPRAGASSSTDDHVGRATPSALGELAARIEIAAGRAAQDARDRRTRLERAGRPRHDARDHLVALGGGVVGDLAGLLRGDLPARRAGRAGADDARRAGRLGLRRQDRRRPAEGQELRRRLPPAASVVTDVRRRSQTLPREERAAGYAEVLKTALIAGGDAVGARAPRRRPPTPT